MQKNLIALSVLSLLPLTAMSTTLQQSRTPWQGVYPLIEPLNNAQMQVLTSDQTTRELKLSLYSRNQSGRWGVVTPVDSLPMDTLSAEPLQWVPQQSVVDSKSVYALLTGAHCEGEPLSCSPRTLAVVQYPNTPGGKFIAPPAVVTPSCSQPSIPEIAVRQGLIQVLDGCGSLLTLQNDTLQVDSQIASAAQQGFGRIDSSWMWSLTTGEGQNRLTATHGSETMSVELDGQDPSCAEVLPDIPTQIKIQCSATLDSKQTWTQLTFSAGSEPATTNSGPFATLRSGVSHKEHLYAITYDEKYEHLINASITDLSLHYSERKLQRRDSTQALQKVQRAPDGKIEQSGFYAAFLQFQEAGRVDLLIFDGIPQNFAPQLYSTSEHLLQTGVRQERPWAVMDEDSLPSELNITAEYPEWLMLDAHSRTFVATPEHKHAGLHLLQQTVADPEGLSLDISWSFDVKLSPFQVMIFEPTWFKRWSLETPVPINLFLKQFPALPIMEDEPFRWQFSVIGRNMEEIELSAQAPDFVKKDNDLTGNTSLGLTGIAQQNHVGDHPGMLIIKDLYASDAEQVSLPWKVIEVDEPFTIDSNPPLEATTGIPYQYTLTFTDEESSRTEMMVTKLNFPAFLQWDPATHVLSGTPSRKDVGTHTIGLLVADQGGHRVVHQWSLRVTETPQDKSGGTTHWGLSLLLFVVALSRKTKI